MRLAGAGARVVDGVYAARPAASVPAGFAKTCAEMRWPVEETWARLSDLARPWYEKEDGCYIYFNRGDKHWWIDGTGGEGLYVAPGDAHDQLLPPPAAGWRPLDGVAAPSPDVSAEVADGRGEL